MIHLFNAAIIALLLTNLAGVGFAARRLTGLPYGLAKSGAVIFGCMFFFWIEHFVAAGDLKWMLLLSTPASLWVLWKRREDWELNRAGEVVFLAGFALCLLWRYPNPDIASSVEKLADLNFIASYMQGGQLPVPDLWLSPYQLTQYYSFQHYGAALMGRILQTPPGVAYNLGYCVLVGLCVAPVWDFLGVFTSRRWHRVLILAVLMTGGTGACVVTPLVLKPEKGESPFSSMRFIGGTDFIIENLNSNGVNLSGLEYGEGEERLQRIDVLELPVEVFSYLIQLGDYHAPLSGYLTLTLALGGVGILLQNPDPKRHRWAWAIVVSTIPITIASNTWSFPFQALLVGGAAVFMMRYRQKPDWPVVAGAAAVSWILFFPFFSYFLSKSVGGGMVPRLVQFYEHAPLLSYLIQMWPVLGLTVFGVFAVRGQQSEYKWFAVFLVVLLWIIEFANIDDIYMFEYDRFNSALKWWSWVASLALLLLAPICLAAPTRQRLVRFGTVLILVASLYYVKILGVHWWRLNKENFGELDGAAWLRKTDLDKENPQNATVNSTILNYLSAHPGGVVLEAPQGDAMAFIPTGAIPLFTGHPAVFGWPSHEQLWRGYQRDIAQRWDRTREFFRGELANPLDFLDGLKVRFIIWPGSLQVDPVLFEKIRGQIESKFDFVSMDPANPLRGIWIRKPTSSTP